MNRTISVFRNTSTKSLRVADIVLLVFFAWIAVRKKSLLVGAMSVLQLGALVYVLNDHTVESSFAILW
jgi:hypothetical protein